MGALEASDDEDGMLVLGVICQRARTTGIYVD